MIQVTYAKTPLKTAATMRLIQEKATDLFFGAPDDEKRHHPDSDHSKAWLFNEKEVVALIRQRYGGDHGANLVRVTIPTQNDFHRWLGRTGGMVSSPRKTRAVRKNALLPPKGAVPRGRPVRVKEVIA